MSEQLISFIVHWGPTIIFLLVLLIAFLFGLIRGMRKTIVLFIQAAVLFGIILIIYFIVVNQESTDGNLFNLVSNIIGEGKIQSFLKVSPENKTFADCFIEFIPKQMDLSDGLALILKDNGQYLATLANMAVRMVIALIFAIFYLIGVFLLYIIYLLFYPQRKHVKKLQDNYEKSEALKKQESLDKRNEWLAKKEEREKKQLEEANSLDEFKDIEEETITENDEVDSLLESVPENEVVVEAKSLENEDIVEEFIEDSKPIDDENVVEEIQEDEEESISDLEEDLGDEPVEYNPKPFEYKKRRLFGGLINVGRKLISLTIIFSFLGALLFTISGGTGDEPLPELEFSNQETNVAYNAYREISSYGSTGIFKVLNTFKDSTNTPYYLFAADLVFQGGLKDENRDINQNVYLRREVAAFTQFARNTFDLLFKYGGDEIRAAVKDPNMSSDQMMETILSIMTKEGFAEEFQVYIDNFEATTYFANLSYSLFSSFVNHIHELGFENLDETTMSLIEILFKKGYLAEQIPYEKKLLDSNSTMEFDYLSPEGVFNKQNFKALANIVFEVVKTSRKTFEDDNEKTLAIVKNVIPLIKDLSFFDETNSKSMSNIFHRLYEFSLNTYVYDMFSEQGYTIEKSDPNINPYTNPKYDGIDFVVEINSTIDSIAEIVNLYQNAYIKDAEIIDIFFNVFDDANPNHAKAMASFAIVKENVSNSFLLGDLLGSTYGKSIIEGLFKTFSDDLKLPTINYSNTKDSQGNIVHGEFYNLLSAIEVFCSHKENKDLITSLREDASTRDPYDLVDQIAFAMNVTDSNGKKAIDYILDSKVFNVVFSNVLLTQDFGTVSIYVDPSLIDTDSEGVKLIHKEEFEIFFNLIPNLINTLRNVEGKSPSELMKSVMTKTVYDVLESKIIEGTITNYIAKNVNIDMVVLPKEVTSLSRAISTPNYDSEVKKLLGLYKLEAFDIEVFTKEYNTSKDQVKAITNMLKNLLDADYDTIYKSKILYYSMSNYIVTNSDTLMDDMNIIVPNSTLDTLTDENIPTVIQKEELKNTFKGVVTIIPNDGDTSDIINDFRGFDDNDYDTIFASKILHYTVSNYLTTNTDMISSDVTLVIPEFTKIDTPTGEVIPKIINSTEIKNLIKGALVILPEEGNFSDIIKEFRRIDTNNEYDQVFASEILHYTMSNYLINNTDIISTDVSLVIPNISKEATPAGEVEPYVITSLEIEKLMRGALVILPAEGDFTDIMKEFRRIDTNNQYDEVFASKILHYTMSNYLNTNADVISSDVTLIIPNESMEATPTGEVDPYVITSLEIEKLMKGALKILPEEGAFTDILKEFRRIDANDEYDQVFDSKILHYTISEHLINNTDIVSADTPLVIPNSVNIPVVSEVVPTLITKIELEALIKGALNIVPESGTITNILDELETKTESDYNLIFNSEIMHFTFSSYLMDNREDFLGDDGDLIIPAAACTIDITEVRERCITKPELIRFLLDAMSILPDDKDNIDVGLVVNSIIQDDSLLDGLILSASMTNMMVNGTTIKDKIDGLIIIPDALKDEATIVMLDSLTNTSTWYFENKNFMKALNALIGDYLSDTFTILDPTLSDKVYEEFGNLNDEVTTGVTKLDIAYESIMMVSTIGKRIDDLDFLDDPKKNSIKIEIDATYLPNNYKKVEISSLVDLINFLDLDLKNTAVMTDALDTAKLLRFNDSPATEFNYSGTYLSYFYLHEIAGLILTKGVEDAIEVPDDAYEVSKLFITENEAKYMISALDTLSLDLNSFSFDPSSLTISDLKNAIFDGEGNTLSKILLTKAGKELMNSVTSLIILQNDYEALYGRITGKALYDFFNAVELMGVVNLDDDPDIANFNVNKPDDVLHTISISSIIRSTLIQYVNIEVNGTHVDPLMYNNTSFVIIANDIDNTGRSQLTQSETYNLMRSINYLSGGTGKVSDISIDLATIKALGDDERDIVLSTEMLKYQISKILLDLPLGYKYYYTDDIALVEIIDIATLVTTPNAELLTKAQINKYIEEHA